MVDNTRKRGIKFATTNRSVREENQQIRQEALRQRLAAANLIGEIGKQEARLESLFNGVSRLRAGHEFELRQIMSKLAITSKAMDSLYRKLAKVLPDLKSVGHDASAVGDDLTSRPH